MAAIKKKVLLKYVLIYLQSQNPFINTKTLI